MLCHHGFRVIAGQWLIYWCNCFVFFVCLFCKFLFVLQKQSYLEMHNVYCFAIAQICCQINAYYLLIWSEPEHLSVTYCLPLPSSVPCLTQQKVSCTSFTSIHLKWPSLFRLINCNVLIITHQNILYYFMLIMNITHCC